MASDDGNEGTSGYAEVGAGVSAILEAAERAADEIRDAARTEAANEARDLRLAAESYGTRQRQEADEEARRIVGQAEQQAREIRDDAEEKAREHMAGAESRLRAIGAEIRYLEAKRERVADALRSIAADIDETLANDRVPDAGAPAAAPPDELPQALAPSARRERGRLRR